ncbi:hypothetical protein B0H66DRAFT_568632 [Apodospora peruviana]|uniref:Chitin-binding type-2 domain-containing protein n=1 Tax=Apodospora peruviana TaxID=516989 RepID=A0AAE0HTK2_9PEZI|nr:hypothetical protein B0H66DRAFT_568632 [Apodospora peruviana]
MRFTSIAAGLVALLSATPVLASLPDTCVMDQFYDDTVPTGTTVTCKWYVCAGNNQYREVRNCGGDRCWTNHPTSCIARNGVPY